MRIDTEVFFRPEEIEREASSIRADLFSRCRRALARSITDCAFVPVRSMQLLAVITRDEVVFVDNLNYAVLEGVPVSLRFYEIKTGGTLADVANVTGVPEDELIRLNPDLSGFLPQGTQVRLP